MSAELARRYAPTLAAPAATPYQLTDLMALGKVLAASGYFGDAQKEAQAVVKVLAGAELGISPIAAMTGIHIVKGKVTLGAGLIASQIRRSARYDYEVRQMTPEVCEIAFLDVRPSEPALIGLSTFTRKDAETAKLIRPDSPWAGHMRNMLFARAMSNGAKWYCPDVFTAGPIYTPDEMGAEVDYSTGEVLELPAEAPPAGGGSDTPAHPGVPRSPASTGSSAGATTETIAAGTEAPAVDPATARWRRLFTDNDVPKPTPAQRDAVKAVLASLGVELAALTDYPTFARAWIAARAQLGRSVGAYTRGSDTEPASFATPVPSEESGAYTTTLHQRGRHECTCEAGQHRRACKHTDVALGYLSAYCDENPYARRDFALVLALGEPLSEEQAAAELAELRSDG